MRSETAILLLKAVMTASWQGSVVMLLILSLRPLLGLRVPARWRCILWTFVLARLLVPTFILPPSPVSLQNIPMVERPGERVAMAFDTAYTNYFSAGRAGNQESNFVGAAIQKPATVTAPSIHWPKIPWWQLGAVIWMAGATLLAARILGATLRLHGRMRRDARAANESVSVIWHSCCERLSLARAPRLLVVPWIDTPALVGVIRPALLIPEKGTETYSRGDWEHVFMHELAHYSRRDHWMHVIELVALCVHWFNPLVWLGFRFLATDRELAADELALKHLKTERAVGYGDTLLKVLSAHSAGGFQPGMIGIVDDSAQLKQRFRRIVAFGPPKVVSSMLGLGLTLAVAIVVLGRESNTADLSRYRGMKPVDALVAAAARNDLPVVRKLLDDGLDINSIASVAGEKTALAAAAAANQLETVRLLVAKGAEINSADGQSSPAYLAAVRNGSLGSAGYLLAKGAVCDPEALAGAKQEDASRNDRVYQVSVPAERGQILDRHGKVLVTNRVRTDLAIIFPSLLLSDADALTFIRQQVATANSVLPERPIDFSETAALRHYKNWGMIPLVIAEDLTPDQQAAVAKQGHGLMLPPVSKRIYPHGSLGAHIFGFVGRGARALDGRLQGDAQLPPEYEEGREGLEAAFNEALTGKFGQRTYHFDAQGKKVSEEITQWPQPGSNVVTTLDLDLQRLCEQALQEGSKRGAIVLIDPNTGEVLAMASWPAFDPNAFTPSVSFKEWRSLNDNPDVPLVGRAFQGAYPPGGMFKVFVGLAAVESGAIKRDEKISSPSSLQIGEHIFRDWKNADRGTLTFAEALEQNADTWFYQAGTKTGANPIVDWAVKFGFSRKTGIPLPGESAGLIPTDDYMKEKLKTDWNGAPEGWLANLSIGQGVTLVTPLQMAQAMATLANGGTFHQTRLVSQLQDHAGKTIGEYKQQRQDQLNIQPEVLADLKKAMVAVVAGHEGTGRAASVNGVQVAGKTGNGILQSACANHLMGIGVEARLFTPRIRQPTNLGHAADASRCTAT